MIKSAYKITYAKYLDVVCDGKLSVLGFGTNKMRQKAWEKIQAEDSKLIDSEDVKYRIELHERYQRLYMKYLKTALCVEVLKHKDSRDCVNVLSIINICSSDEERQRALDIAISHKNGYSLQLKEIEQDIKESASDNTYTRKDYLKEFVAVTRQYPNVTMNSTLAEFRQVQNLIISEIKEAERRKNEQQ